MNKGISFHFGFILNPREQARLIKKYNFDTVITSGDKRFDKQNGKLKNQVKWLKENGVGLSSLHMAYQTKELPEFFKDSKTGKKLEKRLKKDIKDAKKYGFQCVVVHLDGQASEIGFARLERLLKVAEKYDIPLAIENINNQKLFVQTFERISHPYLKFCYDIGHNHFFDPDFDYLKRYGDKLICLHLHSNNGTGDMHTLNKYGNVDWDKFAKAIAKLNKPLNLDYEIMMRYRQNETAQDVLQQVNKQAIDLEKLIEKYKKKSK